MTLLLSSKAGSVTSLHQLLYQCKILLLQQLIAACTQLFISFISGVPSEYPSQHLAQMGDCRSATANKYSQEELLLMKTQDVKYVALKAQTEAKARPATIASCQAGLMTFKDLKLVHSSVFWV